MRGNPGKRGINKNEPSPRLTDLNPPWELDEEERGEWDRISVELSEVGLLTNLDKPAFAMHCYHYVQWQEAVAAVKRTGTLVIIPSDPDEDPANPRPKLPVRNPHTAIGQEHAKQMMRLLTEFGMTPSSRSRTQAAEKKRPSPGWDAI